LSRYVPAGHTVPLEEELELELEDEPDGSIISTTVGVPPQATSIRITELPNSASFM
jgi:hypothetical protein